MKVSGIFAAAAMVVDAGWVQGAYVRDDCHCLDGALNVVCGLAPDDLDRPDFLEDARHELRGHLGSSLVFWNDLPGRTQSEVSRALREAARHALEAGR